MENRALRAICLIAAIALSACQSEKGTSFEVNPKVGDPVKPVPTFARDDIKISPEQTIFVVSRRVKKDGWNDGFIACDFGGETKLEFGTKVNPQRPCKRSERLLPVPGFGSFKTTLSNGQDVYFVLESTRAGINLVPLFRVRGNGYGYGISLEPKSYASIAPVKNAVNVVGDPFDPGYDPEGLAEMLKREIPGLAGIRVVPAQRARVECSESVVKASSLSFADTRKIKTCEIL